MALIVYDKFTTQQELEQKKYHCGLGILRPSKMITSETENGDYSLKIEYPMTEDDTMWQHLSPYNIVRNSEGQLFTIHTCGTQYSGRKAVWSAEASHISYYLADKEVVDCVYTGNCHDALNVMWQHTVISHRNEPIPGAVDYNFRFSSDRKEADHSAHREINFNQINPMSAILGAENSILSLFGGSIHRDNFRISLNRRKEGSRDNAFSIVHGINMIDIRERLCSKDYVTVASGSDNYGYGLILYKKDISVAPHEIFKHKTFSYSAPADSNIDRIRNDLAQYFDANSAGLSATYEVRFKDLRNNDKYKDWAQLQSYKIGDTGVIKSERLGIDVSAAIVSRTLNDITGETESITLGSFSPSLWRGDKFGMFNSDKRLKAIERLRLANMFTWEAN